MRFAIRHEIAGRIRLRLFAGALSEQESRGIERVVEGVAGVRSVAVHAANGSLLVCFAPTAREEVLASVAAIDVLRLPTYEVQPDEEGLALRLEDERFARAAGELVAWKLLRSFALPVPLQAAWTVFRAIGHIAKGLAHLMRGNLTVEVLDATAIGASILRGEFGEADTIMFLLAISDLMQEHVSKRTQLALEQGLVARSNSVWALRDGHEVELPIDEISEGDLIVLRAGSVLPVDGTVESGEAELNESSMTGEAALVHRGPGSSVYSGTAIEDGELVVCVSSPPGEARIDAIAQMVRRSSELKAASQGRAERLADGLVPVAFASFFAILAVTRNIEKALAVLMVDYSCAIRISTPILVMSAMREAAANNVVIKGGKYLEALAEADTVVFDKTGTLTKATPRLQAVVSCGRVSEDGILRLAACIEEHYPHSVARAIVEGAKQRGLSHDVELHTEVRYVVAHGIAANVAGKKTVIGSAHFVFEDEGIACPEGFLKHIEEVAPGSSRVYLARGDELLGGLCIEDPLRENVPQTLRQLRELGISSIVMLTGDSEHAAREVARVAGVTAYRAQVLPEDKAVHVQSLERSGHRCVMVGDGINDSPALAAASVSVAMSDASDIARSVADISIRDDSLERLVMARELSQVLTRRIGQRYRFIVGFNTMLIVLGVASILPLTTAATLHNLSTVTIAALNTRPMLHQK